MLNQGRYAAALPQEAGMYAVVGLAYFMIRYLHRDRKKHVIESDSKKRRFFRMNSYINLRYIKSELILMMFCGIMGALIAIVPTGVSLVRGIQFQESVNWATTVMSGEEWQGSEANYQDELEKAQDKDATNDTDADTVEDNNTDTELFKIDYSGMTFSEIVKHYYDSIYRFGTNVMYGSEPTKLMLLTMEGIQSSLNLSI